jgi:glyoxylase-like metal-dependent hydrolase (beta-lactamase superfamily II)
VSSLVLGADRSRTLDIAMTVWVVQGAGRTILVDAGFYRDKFIRQWKPSPYARPTEALERGLGIQPDVVTDVVLSHIHWDHADGANLFPRARVWIQRDEYEHYVGEGGVAKAGGVDPDVAAMLFSLREAGRGPTFRPRRGCSRSPPRLVIPGHDPAVFARFPQAAPGVARIQ